MILDIIFIWILEYLTIYYYLTKTELIFHSNKIQPGFKGFLDDVVNILRQINECNAMPEARQKAQILIKIYLGSRRLSVLYGRGSFAASSVLKNIGNSRGTD